MSNIPVLIVGAGPTGLMMAYCLARHGISFRIIDKKPEQTQNSNAVALQTRTLEIFKQIGLADDFLRVGQACTTLCFYDQGEEFARASFKNLESIYQFILCLPQASTERILNAKLTDLQHQVERSKTLVDVKINTSNIEATILHNDGIQELITCEWLIGCDGAHSIVREKCGFSFPGDDIKEQFVVADGVMDSFVRSDQINIFSANGYMLGVFPIGGNHYRLGANMNLGYPRKIYTENDIKQLVRERSCDKLSVRDVEWISPFWIHSKMSEKMRQGNVFLVGDAAHIHSPVGGQGMNTGLQDAYNLAWKLALVIQGRAHTKLLDSYQDERYPVIKDVVKTTERFTKVLLLSNPVLLFLRKYFIKLAFSIPMVCHYITQQMTELSIRYKKSCALDTSSGHSSKGPSVGERAPDVNMNHNHYLYSHLNDTYHHVLCFSGDQDIFKTYDVCKQIAIELMGPFKDVLKLHLVTPHLIDESVDQIYDDTNAMHALYQIKKPTIMVIRPDGYISYKSNIGDIDKLKQFLTSYLTG